jgi:hypothetical protein
MHHTTCPDTRAQNDVTKRKNRHLLEVIHSLMLTMNVLKFMCSEAIMTTAYLINRMSSRILRMKIPYEILLGSNMFVVPPRVFECICFVRVHRPMVGKLDPQVIKSIFVGYSSCQKRYKR